MMKTPTEEMYEQLQRAYNLFNQRLFNHELPACLFTLQRKSGCMGYYASNRFYHVKTKDKTDEIAINPYYFSDYDPVEIMQTLVHEMTHLWQAHFGSPSRGGYHNREWANKMKSVGLMPSSTGKPGGKETGQSISDYPIEGGPFLEVFHDLFDEAHTLSWYEKVIKRPPIKEIINLELNDPEDEGIEYSEDLAIPDEISITDEQIKLYASEKGNRLKYTCQSCHTNIWGKPKLNILCMACNVAFKYNFEELI